MPNLQSQITMPRLCFLQLQTSSAYVNICLGNYATVQLFSFGNLPDNTLEYFPKVLQRHFA